MTKLAFNDKSVGAPEDEIEITPAMVEAGVAALWHCDDHLGDDECTVEAIYRAMASSREFAQSPRPDQLESRPVGLVFRQASKSLLPGLVQRS